MEDREMYCPRCGTYSKESETKICKHCGIATIPDGWPVRDTSVIQSHENQKWYHDFFETVIKTNPQFSQEARDEIIKEDMRRFAKGTPNDIHCPYCGYDKFQMVPRRWSLLTGFLTNKVDRVCEKCKKRF